MALRNIVKLGDPILNKTSRKVEKFDDKLAALIDDMLETMYSAVLRRFRSASSKELLLSISAKARWSLLIPKSQ